MNKNILLNLLLIFSLLLASCSSEYKFEHDIENKGLEFRETILLSGVEYPVDKIDVKDIGKGVRYAKMQLTGEEHPLIVHAALIDFTETKGIDVFTASDTQVEDLKTPSEIIAAQTQKGKNILATINGDFFVFETKMSIGTVVKNGEIVKTPNPQTWNTIFGMGADFKPFLNKVKYDMSLTLADDRVIPITAINTRRGGNQLILFDSHYAETTGTNAYGNEFILEPIGVAWEELSSFEEVRCTVVERHPFAGNKPISKGKIVISGHGDPASTVWGGTKLGDVVTIKIKPSYDIDPEAQEVPINCIGAQKPIILKSLNQETDANNAIETNKEPRSGIGYSNDKTRMALIVVEGRSEASVGVTTSEFADIFAYFKISNAVNMDGGGSSCLIINNYNDNKPVNVLTDGQERAVANVISIVER